MTPLRENSESANVPGFFVNVTMDNARTAQNVCAAVTSLFIQENANAAKSSHKTPRRFWVSNWRMQKSN